MSVRPARAAVASPPRRGRLLFAVTGAGALALALAAAPADDAFLLVALEYLLLLLFFPARRGAIDPAAFRITLDDGIAGRLSLPFNRAGEPRFAPGRSACLHDFTVTADAAHDRVVFPDLTLRERLALAPRIATAGAIFRETADTPAGARAADGTLAFTRSLAGLLMLHFFAAVALTASSCDRTVVLTLLVASFALFYLLRSFSGVGRTTAVLYRVGATACALLALVGGSRLDLGPDGAAPAVPGFFATLEGRSLHAAKRAADHAARHYARESNPGRMRILHNLLTHPEADVRWNIACSLRDLRPLDPPLRRAFLTGTADPDLHVRWVCAIRFAGELADREVEPMLDLLHDAVPEAREKAVRVLEQYRGARLDRVRAALHDAWREETDGGMKIRLREALARVGPPRDR